MRRNIRVNTIIGHVSLGSPSAEYEIKPRPKSNTCFFQFFGNCDVFFWDGLRTLSGKIEAIYLIKSLKRLITSCREGRHNRHGLLLCRNGQWRGRRSHAPMYSAHIGTASRHRARLSRDWKGPKSRVLPWDLRFTAPCPFFMKRWTRTDLEKCCGALRESLQAQLEYFPGQAISACIRLRLPMVSRSTLYG